MRHFYPLLALVVMLGSHLSGRAAVPGESMTVFNQNTYDGWTYTRPGVELNTSYISHNSVRLYRNKGADYTLVSPTLDCTEVDTVLVKVTWVTDKCYDETYVHKKTALTIALIDDNDASTDSVTLLPAVPDIQQVLECKLVVSPDCSRPKLRLASWGADVNSNGAVRVVQVTAGERASATAPVPGDVNADGVVNANDIAAVVNIIAGIEADAAEVDRADVNCDGVVNANDIAAVVNIIAGVQTAD